jgi:hypothetical protein
MGLGETAVHIEGGSFSCLRIVSAAGGDEDSESRLDPAQVAHQHQSVHTSATQAPPKHKTTFPRSSTGDQRLPPGSSVCHLRTTKTHQADLQRSINGGSRPPAIGSGGAIPAATITPADLSLSFVVK